MFRIQRSTYVNLATVIAMVSPPMTEPDLLAGEFLRTTMRPSLS